MEKAVRTPIVDFDQSDSPIYLQLVTLFRRQISQGYWPVGERLNSIDTLAQQFGVATGTVRQALAFLEREGLVQRKRRLGTIVLKRPDTLAPMTMPRSRADLVRFLDAMKSAPLDTSGDASDGKTAESHVYSRGETPVLIENLRFDGEAFTRSAPPMAQLGAPGFADHGLRQTTTIGTADTRTSQILGIPVNAAVALMSHSLTTPQGEVVLEAQWLIRGDAVNFVESFDTTRVTG
ncbi:MAG: GntR family transcriptional regulator [Pseudomonadota bacterium]|nr:GntR family transcriptional regulator [Pseudomonadota bacterium]